MYNSLNEITQADQLLQSLGLGNYSQIEPKKSWTKLLKESMSLITKLPQELFILKNVFDCYLTEIIWLAAKDGNSNIASAAYPEAPGKVFVSTGVFYYVPPFTTFQKFSKYAAFENMMHECLHHRAEQIIQANSILNHFMSSSVHCVFRPSRPPNPASFRPVISEHSAHPLGAKRRRACMLISFCG